MNATNDAQHHPGPAVSGYFWNQSKLLNFIDFWIRIKTKTHIELIMSDLCMWIKTKTCLAWNARLDTTISCASNMENKVDVITTS